jgi:hypothetical protein
MLVLPPAFHLCLDYFQSFHRLGGDFRKTILRRRKNYVSHHGFTVDRTIFTCSYPPYELMRRIATAYSSEYIGFADSKGICVWRYMLNMTRYISYKSAVTCDISLNPFPLISLFTAVSSLGVLPCNHLEHL